MEKCKRCDYVREITETGYCEKCNAARDRDPILLDRNGDTVEFAGETWGVEHDLYTLSQVNDNMKDGDVIVIPDGDTPIVFTLLLAWPVQVSGRKLRGLHTFESEEFVRHAIGPKGLRYVDFDFVNEAIAESE